MRLLRLLIRRALIHYRRWVTGRSSRNCFALFHPKATCTRSATCWEKCTQLPYPMTVSVQTHTHTLAQPSLFLTVMNTSEYTIIIWRKFQFTLEPQSRQIHTTHYQTDFIFLAALSTSSRSEKKEAPLLSALFYLHSHTTHVRDPLCLIMRPAGWGNKWTKTWEEEEEMRWWWWWGRGDKELGKEREREWEQIAEVNNDVVVDGRLFGCFSNNWGHFTRPGPRQDKTRSRSTIMFHSYSETSNNHSSQI